MRIGDVVQIWDRQTRPQKSKLHICICPKRQLFFRINSKPLFPPHMKIHADGADFLEHDSFVELQQLVRHIEYETERAKIIGRLSGTHVRALVLNVQATDALSEDLKDLILEQLNTLDS